MRKLVQAVTMLTALACGAAPAAMLYVDPANPGAVDAGAGDALHPYRTLVYAMKQLKPGDTLTIAAGVYRESVVFPAMSWSDGTTVVQPAAGAQVLVKGSDVVTGWTPLGDGRFVRSGWTVNSQQVFVDGIALQQIGGKIFNNDPWIWPGRVAGGLAEMTDNSFYYDLAAQNLYVKVPRTSLDGHTVEVSVRGKLVDATNVHNVTLRNLRFQHANITATAQNGAVTFWRCNGNTLEGLEVTESDGAGFDVTGEDNVLRNNKANRNGQVGMKVRGRRTLLEGNETNHNNTRGFNKWWEAGGAKFAGEGGLIDSTVRRHVAVGNLGDGIWFDWFNTNNQIYENLSAYNSGMGIHYEASQNGYFYNNFVFANGQRGIYLPHSSGSVVAFNMVAKNGMEGIVIVDEGRNPDDPRLRPTGNLVHGNIVAWNGRSALILPLALADNRSDYNLFLDLAQPMFSLGWPSKESPIRNGLDAWRAASGQDLNSWHQAFDVPATLVAAFDQKTPYPDWSEVLARGSTLTVPALSDILPAHTKPGPSLQLMAAVADPGDTGGDTGGSTKPGKGLGRNKSK
jgi:parallel beta-helix repeat protein